MQRIIKKFLDQPIAEKIKYVIIFILLINFGFFVFISIKQILYPYQLDYAEGLELYQATNFDLDTTIYGKLDDPLFVPTNYPPIHIFILSLLVKIFGVNFLAGRTFSFIISILIVFLAYKITFILSNKKTTSLVAALLIYSSQTILVWLSLVRVDPLAVLFSLIGFYLILRYQKSNWLYLSIIFFVLAFFTKHSFISAPVAFIIYLFINKEYKKLIKFTSIFFISLLSGIVVLNLLTQNQFTLHIFKYLTSGSVMDLSMVLFRIHESALIDLLIYLFGGTFLFINLFKNKKSFYLLIIYAIISLFLTFITLVRLGSNTNYFIEIIIFLSICASLFIDDTIKFVTYSNYKNIFVVIISTILIFDLICIPVNLYKNSHVFLNYLKHINLETLKRIDQVNAPIFSENATLSLLTNKGTPIDIFMLSQLDRSNIKKLDDFNNQIVDQKLNLIILETNIFDDSKIINGILGRFNYSTIKLIKNNYLLKEKIGGDCPSCHNYYLFTPKKN
ncbi:MAG: glycosyltransferase family 39 protein [Patescibacteria group bacterium]|jgi:hypothetical protein|nr:glycosyltransferase family 39 protein [Patescibacteria group bacterium]